MDIKYITFNLSEVDKINFEEVFENSIDTLRVSKSNISFVHYAGDMPTSILSLNTKSQEYTVFEILSLLENSDWLIYEEGITGTTITNTSTPTG
jgi:hypothetical protein